MAGLVDDEAAQVVAELEARSLGTLRVVETIERRHAFGDGAGVVAGDDAPATVGRHVVNVGACVGDCASAA